MPRKQNRDVKVFRAPSLALRNGARMPPLASAIILQVKICIQSQLEFCPYLDAIGSRAAKTVIPGKALKKSKIEKNLSEEIALVSVFRVGRESFSVLTGNM
jgi:hypothetical protein